MSRLDLGRSAYQLSGGFSMVSRRLATIVAGVALGTAPTTASAASAEAVRPTTPSARIRVAVAMESEQRLAFPPEFGEHAAARALAQGVREACISTTTAPSTGQSCIEISDAPGSRVCVDETLARSLSREIECAPSDTSADVIDLSASSCQTAECLQLAARAAQATHLLLVSGAWHDGLIIDGTLTSLGDARRVPVGPSAAYNAQRPRTGPQVLAIIKWVARDAVVAELRRAREVELAASREVAIVPPAPVSPPAALVLTPPPVEEPRHGSSRRVIGWTLIATGVVAGAASGWLFAIDKQDVGCSGIPGDPEPCSKVRRTIVPAIGAGAGAAAALIAGAVLLINGDERGGGSMAIGAGPGGLAVGGRF
jgi:hypothetical protein